MLKRFIRYLYEYEGNQKKRNVGFVKVEQDGKEATVSVHGKGLCGKRNEKISCYLIKLDLQTGKVVLIPAGEIRIDMASCGGNFCYTENLIKPDSQISSSKAEIWEEKCQNAGENDICGLGLGNPAGAFYMALWNEEMYRDIDITKATVEEEKESMTGQEAEEEEENMTSQEAEEEEENTTCQEAVVEAEDGTLGSCDEKNEEVPAEPADEKREEVIPKRQIMKIQRGEISILPRCEWKLANNNFLLHGYYNYRHLVLIDEGDKLKLGVPGIYHEREARAAATFGFPEFITESDVKVTLEPQERNENQQFGYWCRQVRRPPR